MVQMFCFMFHNLVTKQGRISELTLPATNLERFLWHAGCSFLGTISVFMASVVVADIVHAILGLVVFGITDPQSITLATWDVFFSFSDLAHGNNLALMFFIILMFLNFIRNASPAHVYIAGMDGYSTEGNYFKQSTDYGSDTFSRRNSQIQEKLIEFSRDLKLTLITESLYRI